MAAHKQLEIRRLGQLQSRPIKHNHAAQNPHDAKQPDPQPGHAHNQTDEKALGPLRQLSGRLKGLVQALAVQPLGGDERTGQALGQRDGGRQPGHHEHVVDEDGGAGENAKATHRRDGAEDGRVKGSGRRQRGDEHGEARVAHRVRHQATERVRFAAVRGEGGRGREPVAVGRTSDDGAALAAHESPPELATKGGRRGSGADQSGSLWRLRRRRRHWGTVRGVR